MESNLNSPSPDVLPAPAPVTVPETEPVIVPQTDPDEDPFNVPGPKVDPTPKG